MNNKESSNSISDRTSQENAYREKIAALHSSLYEQAIDEISSGIKRVGKAIEESKLASGTEGGYSDDSGSGHKPLLGASALNMICNMWITTRSMTESMHSKPEHQNDRDTSPGDFFGSMIRRATEGKTAFKVIDFGGIETSKDEDEPVAVTDDSGPECDCPACSAKRALSGTSKSQAEASIFSPSASEAERKVEHIGVAIAATLQQAEFALITPTIDTTMKAVVYGLTHNKVVAAEDVASILQLALTNAIECMEGYKKNESEVRSE